MQVIVRGRDGRLADIAQPSVVRPPRAVTVTGMREVIRVRLRMPRFERRSVPAELVADARHGAAPGRFEVCDASPVPPRRWSDVESQDNLAR